MSTVYAIIKYTLDDFSGLEDACECYEQWLPVDIPVITRAMYEEAIIHHRKI